ncbi:hypothetical protein [Saccharopolyspora sp. 5N708]
MNDPELVLCREFRSGDDATRCLAEGVHHVRAAGLGPVRGGRW